MTREGERKRDRVDRIFRETGCHIHVLTPSWLTNGLLLSQARVTARAWPRRVVFPENRLKRIRVYNIRLVFIENSVLYELRVISNSNIARNRMSNMLIRISPEKASKKNFISCVFH